MIRPIAITAVLASCLLPLSALPSAAAGDGDIHSDEEALARAGMCVYPADYVDTLAQGSMAPAETADAGHEPDSPKPADGADTTQAILARILGARLYAGGMTALPVPLSALIEARGPGG